MSGWTDALALSDEHRKLVDQASEPLPVLLHELGYPPADVLDALSQHHSCPWVSLSRYEPEAAAVSLLTEKQARRFRALPLFRVGERLYLALSDPSALQTIDSVASLTGCLVEPVVALPEDIDEAINRAMLTREESGKTLQAISSSMLQESPAGPSEVQLLEDRENPIVQLVDHIQAQAIRLGASDLHLEPSAQGIVMRYRIDGLLNEFPAPPRSLYGAVVSRIKITSGMDIAERRLPQDGRASIVVDDLEYDLRVSAIPGVHGEGIVIRICNPRALKLELAELGFEPDVLTRYRSLLEQRHGIVLVTGPTGAGKSTTLYATLNAVRSPSLKTVTLEDPVEALLTGVQQIQVYPEIGYTFAQGLKSILRHDPDIIMVGEIRDLESAQIAIRAALTGHQIFSTLHTNGAAQAIPRLVDMGVPLYQVLASVNAILDQRLVRRLCPECKVRRPGRLPEQLASEWNLDPRQEIPLSFAAGCSECNQLGYRGRLAVQELLELTPDLREAALGGFRQQDLIREARQAGAYFSLRRSLAAKVIAGLTSLDEALGQAGPKGPAV